MTLAGVALEGCSVAGLETSIMLPRWWVRRQHHAMHGSHACTIWGQPRGMCSIPASSQLLAFNPLMSIAMMHLLAKTCCIRCAVFCGWLRKVVFDLGRCTHRACHMQTAFVSHGESGRPGPYL